MTGEITNSSFEDSCSEIEDSQENYNTSQINHYTLKTKVQTSSFDVVSHRKKFGSTQSWAEAEANVKNAMV